MSLSVSMLAEGDRGIKLIFILPERRKNIKTTTAIKYSRVQMDLREMNQQLYTVFRELHHSYMCFSKQ